MAMFGYNLLYIIYFFVYASHLSIDLISLNDFRRNLFNKFYPFFGLRRIQYIRTKLKKIELLCFGLLHAKISQFWNYYNIFTRYIVTMAM